VKLLSPFPVSMEWCLVKHRDNFSVIFTFTKIFFINPYTYHKCKFLIIKIEKMCVNYTLIYRIFRETRIMKRTPLWNY